MHTTDRAALLQAILADPAGDSARLVYADALEEEGQQERAEFIRVQLAIVAWRTYVPPPEIEEIRQSGRLYAYQAGLLIDEKATEHNQRLVALRRRERELVDAHGYKWFPAEQHGLLWGITNPPLLDDERAQYVTFRRGFVESVTCSAADWLTHADALLAAHPITEVRLTTPLNADFSYGKAGLLALDVYRRVQAFGDFRVYPHLLGPDHVRTVLTAEWPRIRTWHLPGTTSAS